MIDIVFAMLRARVAACSVFKQDGDKAGSSNLIKTFEQGELKGLRCPLMERKKNKLLEELAERNKALETLSWSC